MARKGSGLMSGGMKGHGGGRTVGDRHTVPMAGPKSGMASSTGPTNMGGGKSGGKAGSKMKGGSSKGYGY